MFLHPPRSPLLLRPIPMMNPPPSWFLLEMFLSTSKWVTRITCNLINTNINIMYRLDRSVILLTSIPQSLHLQLNQSPPHLQPVGSIYPTFSNSLAPEANNSRLLRLNLNPHHRRLLWEILTTGRTFYDSSQANRRHHQRPLYHLSANHKQRRKLISRRFSMSCSK